MKVRKDYVRQKKAVQSPSLSCSIHDCSLQPHKSTPAWEKAPWSRKTQARSPRRKKIDSSKMRMNTLIKVISPILCLEQ